MVLLNALTGQVGFISCLVMLFRICLALPASKVIAESCYMIGKRLSPGVWLYCGHFLPTWRLESTDGKNLPQNLKIIKNIKKFKIGKYGLLMGVSRKSWINSIDKSNVNERLGGSLAPVLFSQNQGVDIFRVHDVKETFQAIKVFKRIECSK